MDDRYSVVGVHGWINSSIELTDENFKVVYKILDMFKSSDDSFPGTTDSMEILVRYADKWMIPEDNSKPIEAFVRLRLETIDPGGDYITRVLTVSMSGIKRIVANILISEQPDGSMKCRILPRFGVNDLNMFSDANSLLLPISKIIDKCNDMNVQFKRMSNEGESK